MRAKDRIWMRDLLARLGRKLYPPPTREDADRLMAEGDEAPMSEEAIQRIARNVVNDERG